MLIEKLTIKDTFRIWRDKINILLEYFGRVPATDKDGNFIINEEITKTKKFIVDVPSLFTDTITADKGFTGNLIGNANTATSLINEPEINGTIFVGDKDIVTRKWGAERKFTIWDSTFKNKGTSLLIDGSNEDGYNITLPQTITGNLTGTADIAKRLENAVQIDGIKFDGTKNVTHYGYCTTESSENNKIVELYVSPQENTKQEFTLSVGSFITVKFKNKNTATGVLTLNVNGSGNKQIINNGLPIEEHFITENSVFTFVYDGTAYNLIGDDNKVSQSVTYDDIEYPILVSSILDGTTKTIGTLYAQGITINPSLNTLTVENNVATNTVTTSSISAPNGILSIDITPKGTANVIDPSRTNLENMDDVGSETLQKSVYTRTININYDEDKESYFNDSCEINIGGDIGYVDNIYCAGDVCADKVHNALWNDYAEFFEKGEETESGDIIALDISSSTEQYIKATKDSPLIIGVHSDTYGHILGGLKDGIEASKQFFIPVGLKGRVNVKFKGKSQLGEAVVPSDIPGVGCLYDSSVNTERQIIGYIVEDSSNTEELRRVKIFLK